MAEGAGEGERRGRRERHFAERMAIERLYLEMMPTMLRDGVTLRDFIAVKNSALQSLSQTHKDECKVAVDTCYLKKKQSGKMDEFYQPRGWRPPEPLREAGRAHYKNLSRHRMAKDNPSTDTKSRAANKFNKSWPRKPFNHKQ
eukprot:gene7369-497_t